MIRFEFRNIEAWIAGATRFGGQYPNSCAPKFDAVSEKLFARTQAKVHVLSGELKASGRVIPASSSKSGLGVEALEGGVEYTSDHGTWEMLRGGEHDFMSEPLAETISEYADVFEFQFKAVLDGWR